MFKVMKIKFSQGDSNKGSRKNSFWKWTKRILVGLAIFVALWAIYFFLTFFTNLWMYYPGIYRFQAAFSRLQLSCQNYPYGGMCKGRCGIERERYRQTIADYLNKDETNIARDQVKKTILDEKNLDCFRTELVDSVYLAQKKKNPDKNKINPPQFLTDYLVGKNGGEFNGSNFVSQEILNLYGQSVFSGTLSDKFIQIIEDPKAGCEVKYNAIENLGRYGNDEITRPIFQKLIEENKDPDHLWIGYEAAQSIGVPKQKDRKFVKWCEDIIWGDYNSYVKEEIIGVLSDYKNHNLGEKQYILDILKKIYFDKSQSKFLRDDAASILQYNLGKGSEKLYPNPEISDEEFDEHEANSPESLPFPQYCKNFQK